MKPYFSDKIFFTATKEEIQMLRTAISNLEYALRNQKTLQIYKEHLMALKLRDDLDAILKTLPF